MELINLIFISWVFSSQASFLSELIPDKKIFIIPKYIMSCPKCSGFWISLIICQNLYMAAIVSFSLYLWSLIENKLFGSTEL